MGVDLERRRRIARWAPRVSLALFVLALPLPALDTATGGFGVEMLLLGWLGPAGGQVGWYANVPLVASWIGVSAWANDPSGAKRRSTERPRRVAVALVGAALAASTLVTMDRVSMFTPWTHGVVMSFGPGMYLWLASHLAALVGALATSAEAPSPGGA